MCSINELDKKLCTGCGACFNICPKKAITMEKNSEGFLEPVIDKSKCVNCGLCKKVCPQLKEDVCLNETNQVFGIRCNDSVRYNCSSGGVFGAIARWAVSNDGVVFGAAFSDDYKRVVHVKATNENELKKLYKSKYLQSDTGSIFTEVKKCLETSKSPVVFAGCPCQVSGLKSFLMKDYDNLITIDILCHGVVSPGAYEKFLNEFFGDVDSPIKNVDFRSKKLGWACNLLVEAEDGTERISTYSGDYFNAFLWGYSQRNVCFECKYANQKRIGDITIGDFWGIDRILPEINDNKGVSLVLCNTQKGFNVINKINNFVDIKKECDYDKMLNAVKDINWALYKPGIKPKNRDVFFYRLSRGDTFSEALRYASSPKYDVGIFGWWFEDKWTNYGSTLVYYALMEYVSSLGLSVCMITSPFHKRDNASEFVRKHGYVMTETYPFSDFSKHNKNIDTFLIGSDQLWFYHCYKTWGHSLFLDFVDDNKKKISYATSFGHKDPKIPSEEIPVLKKLLERFDALSVRELDGVDIMSNLFNLQAFQNVDPVFLCDIKNWQSVANDAERKTEGDFIFTYMLDPSDEKIKALNYISKKLNIKVVSVTDKQYDNNTKVNYLKKYGVLENATIPEQIYHLMNAKYVVTDSFHGTCFSIIFRKNFVAIVNAKRGTSRFETLAKLFGVGDRFVYDPEEICKNPNLLIRPDYSKIEPRLEKEISRSKAWLNDALLNNKTKKPVTQTISSQLEKFENSQHKAIIEEFFTLQNLGYSVGRFLKDLKIFHISIYCEEKNLDILEPFLISLQLDDSVVIDGCYSNKAFEFKHSQSINFGRNFFVKGFPISGTVIYVNDDIKTINIPNCNVLNLLSLLWKSLAYATVYRPFVEFKKLHPKVNILCLNYPIFPPEGKRDERENYIISHKTEYEYINLIKKIPDTFSVFDNKNYTPKDWTELFETAKSEIDISGKRHYFDLSSKLINIQNNHRLTKNQPDNSDKTIFMLGGCGTFGYGCSDNDTSSTQLQALFNANNINYKVENYGSFLNYRRKDMYNILFDLPVHDGDVIVAEVWNNIPEICTNYFDFLNLRELFFRPHSYGNVFLDYSHLSHIGHKVIAENLYNFIANKNYYKENTFDESPKIDISPMNVFGVPNEFISWGEDHCNPELETYLNSLKKYHDKIGAIVMNCNPFTLGHRYLIESASKQCRKLFVFVVEEDKSVFKFADRIELVKKGVANLDNVIVLPSGKFMISSLTFTDYFNKSKLQDKQIDPTMDVEIFAKYIAPTIGVNVRFAGAEPLDKVTNQYNQKMKEILPRYGIEFQEIARKEESGNVISASLVRKYLENKNFSAIKKIVPKTTYEFLVKHYK